jgi:hypothetical protein
MKNRIGVFNLVHILRLGSSVYLPNPFNVIAISQLPVPFFLAHKCPSASNFSLTVTHFPKVFIFFARNLLFPSFEKL